MPTSYQTDLSKLPVVMQGYQPCCVEASLAAYLEYKLLIKTGIYTPLSFRYLATKTAAIDGINYASSGTSLAVALQVLKTIGICTAATYSNDIQVSPTEFVMPSLIPAGADDEAANYKIFDYKILEDITWENLNAAIDEYKLVLTGLYLDKEWYLSSTPNSNPLPLPPPLGMTDPSISKHMTLSYGYDSTNRYVRNSFGNTFGNNGNGYYTQAYQSYIFSAAVILDPVEEVQQQVTQVAQAVDKINPTAPTASKQENLIEEAIEFIEEEIKQL